MSHFGFSQTYICWRAEVALINPSTGVFEPVSKKDMNSEAFFSNSTIRINDADIFLTKQSIASRNVTSNGTVTVYNVTNRKNQPLIAIVVEDSKGILRVSITQANVDVAVIYYIKNR